VLWQPQEPARVLFYYREGPVGRTVVNNNYFKRVITGAIDSLKAVSDGLFAVVVRNNNGDEGVQRKPRAKTRAINKKEAPEEASFLKIAY
jgi:hypothetical protein